MSYVTRYTPMKDGQPLSPPKRTKWQAAQQLGDAIAKHAETADGTRQHWIAYTTLVVLNIGRGLAPDGTHWYLKTSWEWRE